MKILCVISDLGSGGAQRQLVELALAFKECGHEVSFLTYYDDSYYVNTLFESNIFVTCIKEPNYFLRYFKMRRIIRRGKFDSVLSFLEVSNFICETAGIPHRTWKLVVGERSANPRILKSVKLKIYRWFHLFADYVVANSHTNIQLVRSINPLLHEAKCKVIYNVVNFNRWKPSGAYAPRKDGKIHLVIASSHRHLKNLGGLVEALAKLSPTEQFMLAVEWYGDCIDNSLIESKTTIEKYRLEKVISFYPATHEITKIIQDADVVGLFSFYEGFPNAVCEGMACGKPVVCSAVSDLPDILGHSSKLLCNPADHVSIRNAIRNVLNLSNEELMLLGNQNVIIAKNKFNKDDIVSQYLALLT